ncbi:hypothetical protein KIL84_017239 [Mauremys mutica]|uniref:Uncharacterized protein n=1 Tax=Mauremys mutica TaxID=74926 RepID=A0A9D4AYG9_9SAUR|nr:hypothetical protein KIL84_017239 [Mauremys mutica]
MQGFLQREVFRRPENPPAPICKTRKLRLAGADVTPVGRFQVTFHSEEMSKLNVQVTSPEDGLCIKRGQAL